MSETDDWFDDQLCIMLVEYGIIEEGNLEDLEYFEH